MSDHPLIQVSGVSKKFNRCLKSSLWYGLHDLAGQFLGRQDQSRLREGEFWALRHVTFDLRKGDALAIVGNNGAGKSTLLKLLMGRLIPSAGRVRAHGKIAAISELGLGFNPVLTGRENVYINAALLGLPRSKTQLIFDKIVDFAGIGEFIDAPVQGYSTGMRARLGYAVAAHLNTDILLIDEVLAVGDMGFRRKCRQHIRQYLNDGGTLILISHDMHAVQTICNRCIVLEKGKILFDGDVTSGVHVYYESQREHLQDETASEEKTTSDSNEREVHRNGAHANGKLAAERSGELAAEVSTRNPLDAILGDLSNRSEATDLSPEDLPAEKCNCQSSEAEVATETDVSSDSYAQGDDDPVSLEESLSYPADVDDPTPEEGEELAPVEVGGAGYDSEWSGDRALATETRIVIKAVHLRSVSGEVVRTGDDVQVTIDYWSAEDIPDLVWGFSLCTQDLGAHIGSGVFGFEGRTVDIHAGHGQLHCVIKKFPLMPGRYAVKAGIAESATGAEIANVGWDGAPAYFRVAATPSPLANIHSVLGDLVKLDIDWK